MVDRLLTAETDHVGILESYERRWHYQSFLLGFSPTAIRHPAFKRFWRDIRVGNRDAVITHYEIRMLSVLRAGGLTSSALIASSPNDKTNPTLTKWATILDQGFPFVKVQLIRDNPHAADISHWETIMAERGYDTEMVKRHLKIADPNEAPSANE